MVNVNFSRGFYNPTTHFHNSTGFHFRTPQVSQYFARKYEQVVLEETVFLFKKKNGKEITKKMTKILIINGHPNKDSFNFALADAYKNGALKSGAEVSEIIIRDLKFNPNLQAGYQKRTELEPDLLDAWEKIKWADHLVWIHPVWWGGLPAITKGFIDRLFLPGFAFQYRENSVWWDKLLKGKTAHIITTLDQPGWYYRLMFGQPSVNQLKKSTLEFCGVKPVKTTLLGPMKSSKEADRKKWLEKVEQFGHNAAQ